MFLPCVICSSMRRCRYCLRRRFWWRCSRSPILGERIGPRRWAAIIVGFMRHFDHHSPGLGQHASAALSHRGRHILFRALQHQHAHFVGERFQRHHIVLFQSVRRCGDVGGVPFVWTSPSSWSQVAMMVIMGACGALWALPSHSRAPACAGIDPRAVHLYATDLGRAFRAIWCSAICPITGR